MTDRLLLAGPRDLSGSLDGDGGARVVVACPPHPRPGGDRHDSRLDAVSDAVTAEGIDCLRFDYGPWDGGRGERTDVGTAVDWARQEYDCVGLFGFSFGAATAILAAGADDGPTPDVLSALAPAAQVSADGNVVAALDRVGCPVQVVCGERDDTADWEPVVDRARELGLSTETLPADHFFVGQRAKVAGVVAEFLVAHLG